MHYDAVVRLVMRNLCPGICVGCSEQPFSTLVIWAVFSQQAVESILEFLSVLDWQLPFDTSSVDVLYYMTVHMMLKNRTLYQDLLRHSTFSSEWFGTLASRASRLQFLLAQVTFSSQICDIWYLKSKMSLAWWASLAHFLLAPSAKY